MAKAVKLSNGREWPSKTAALQHFKAMLARYRNGQRVIDPDDHSDLSALIARYDSTALNEDEKKGLGGVDYFSRELNVAEHFRTPGFHVHRLDGTSIDFSYVHAVNGNPES